MKAIDLYIQKDNNTCRFYLSTYTMNTTQHQPEHEIIPDSPQNPFLDEPILINWANSYYPRALRYRDEQYVIHKKPQENYYKNGRYFVEVQKLPRSNSYKGNRETSTMIYDKGRIMPFVHWLKKCFDKLPIIITQTNGYMKYDQDLCCSKLNGIPEWYLIMAISEDNLAIHLGKANSELLVYTFDKNLSVVPIPENSKENIQDTTKENLFHDIKEQ